METPLNKFAQAVRELFDNENRRKIENQSGVEVILEIFTRAKYEKLYFFAGGKRHCFTKEELDSAEEHEMGFIKELEFSPYKKVRFHLQKQL